MKTNIHVIPLLLALSVAIQALADTADTGYQPGDSARRADNAAGIDVPPEAQPAVDVVDAFGEALAAADFDRVEAMLDPNVIVLEGGGIESGRPEYLRHHARSDARFLAGADLQLIRRRAWVDDSLAWVASLAELHTQNEGKPLVLLIAETMVLRNTPSGWRIVHIHWSSRSKESEKGSPDPGT